MFNLHHSSAHNAIEHIFGVLKQQFQILLLAPEYSLEVQARIPAALSAIHNFISIHNPHDKPISSTTSNGVQIYNDVDEAFTSAGALEPNDVDLCWDIIAQKMWDDYVLICEEQGIDMDDVLGSELEEDEEDEGNSERDDEGL